MASSKSIHLKPMLCPAPCCGEEISFAATVCTECGYQAVGYPNVRYASDSTESAVLDQKLKSAFALAAQSGSVSQLTKFHEAAKRSVAITVMSFSDLHVLLKDSRLWVSFYKQVYGAGNRKGEMNKWDMNRTSNDQKVNPQYYHEINYAALSLGDLGAGWYGGCHVTLDSKKIETRTSVFWENPFSFLRRVVVPPDELIPPGYRAPWEKRGDLAVAKLHEKIKPSTSEESFQQIILENDPARGDTDFIEVHIYGPVGRTAILEVSVNSAQLGEDDALEWESVKRRLSKLGIPVKEIGNA